MTYAMRPLRLAVAASLAAVALLAAAPARATGIASVAYQVTSSWSGAFQASVTITNESPTQPIANWTMRLSLPYAITSIWDASIRSQHGGSYTIVGPSWEQTIPAGGSVSFGLIAADSGSQQLNPSNCSLNAYPVDSTTCTPIGKGAPPHVPGSLGSPSQWPNAIALKWKASKPGTNPVAGYNVYVNGALAGSPSSPELYVPNLQPNTTYAVAVQAFDGVGDVSKTSPAIDVVTQPAGSGAVFAPYVDVGLYPTFQLTKNAPKASYEYTLAFVTSMGQCTAAWAGVTPVSQGFMAGDIANLRSIGGNVIASFGGEAGTELAQSCPDVTSLLAQYQSVVTDYSLGAIDFDIEGAAIDDPTSIDLRNQALAQLEQANPSLRVSYTLPVMPWGLTQNGVNLLADAIADGVRVDVVNVMTMDYGYPASHMGQEAIDAANALYGQLAQLYPAKTAQQLYAMIGITPMIGQNDTQGETFALSDARLVLNYADANGIGLLAMWSAARDRACKGGAEPRTVVNAKIGRRRLISGASSTCSGIKQKPWAFSAIFKQVK